MSQIKAVLFDLDGTLLDTAHDMMNALNQLRAEEKLAPLPYEQVRCQVSHGGHALVRLWFGELPPTEHEVMRMRLLNIYRTAARETHGAVRRRRRNAAPNSNGAAWPGASSPTSRAGSPSPCWSK